MGGHLDRGLSAPPLHLVDLAIPARTDEVGRPQVGANLGFKVHICVYVTALLRGTGKSSRLKEEGKMPFVS